MEKKHLTLQDRQNIEQMLNARKNFVEIALVLGKNKSTISREVKGHCEHFRIGAHGQNYNACKNRYNCRKTRICATCNSTMKFKLCHRCAVCNLHCADFEKEQCPRHTKPPYVCNGCGKRSFCTLEKKVYAANDAHEEYRALLSESRKGCSYTEEELLWLDRLISPLIQQGQSPHHVYATNGDSLMVSERTIYRLIDSRVISAMNMDLPRKLRFKGRRKKKEFKVDKACRIGRDFHCFQKFLEENPGTPVIQLDSVEGKKGGKVLLTIHFVKCEMMLAFLRDANTARSTGDWAIQNSRTSSRSAWQITAASLPILWLLSLIRWTVSGEPGFTTATQMLRTRRDPLKGTTNSFVVSFPKGSILGSILRMILRS